MKKYICILLSWLLIPHLLFFSLSKNKHIIVKDILRWMYCAHIPCIFSDRNIETQVDEIEEGVWGRLIRRGRDIIFILYGMFYLLLFVKEYRNVFYLRIGKISKLLCYLPPLSSLYIFTKSDDFGAGTFIQHGFSTIIIAEHIGINCWINQQVTIGYNDSRKYGYGKPYIGDNVRISAGAKVVGKVVIGDNSIIGVNSVVVKSVPANSVVVPSPMMLIQERGNAVYTKL